MYPYIKSLEVITYKAEVVKGALLSLGGITVHEITAGHRSLSGTITCVTDRIPFLPVTMTGRYIIYRRPARIASDRHKVPTAGHVRHWRNIYFRRCKAYLYIYLDINRREIIGV